LLLLLAFIRIGNLVEPLFDDVKVPDRSRLIWELEKASTPNKMTNEMIRQKKIRSIIDMFMLC